ENVYQTLIKALSAAHDTNPYASAETLRALDATIKAALTTPIEQLATAVRQRYEAAARAGIPTRAQPIPDPAVLEQIRTWKAVRDQITEVLTAIQVMEMPNADRVYHRIRDNTALLETLIEYDRNLLGHAQPIEELTAQVHHMADEASETVRTTLTPVLSGLSQALRKRQDLIRSLGVRDS
ncbi:hypothetical protein, partial [Methylacidiphilum caldifontis]|uniref:hypothetical protein n=1 Tax=Methylacidiphilum caldifontis TaxID=2795386 RepID=UPI00141BCC33